MLLLLLLLLHDREHGRLRIEIDGTWTVEDFEELLKLLRAAYVQLDGLDSLARSVECERDDKKTKRQHFSHLSNQALATEKGLPPSEQSDRARVFLTAMADRYGMALYLGNMKYSSPGWIEVIGNWNPLKVLADAVAAWQKEKTARKRIEPQHQIKMAQLKADLFKAILKTAEPLEGACTAMTLQDVVGAVHDVTNQTVTAIAKDERVTNVKLLSAPPAPETNDSTPD